MGLLELSNCPINQIRSIRLRGLKLHAITEQQCIELILNELDAHRGGWVVTPNLDHLRRQVRDPSYAKLCQEATLIVADGMPLVWASRIQGTPLPQRVAGSSLISTLSDAAAKRGKSIFLLGGDLHTAEQAADVLAKKYKDLKIAGTHYPSPGFESDPQAIAKLTQTIRQSKPDIVYVALGSPKQERLIENLRHDVPEFASIWWLGVGISFSFLSGHVLRAPIWIQNMGLEWAHRLVQEPRRLAKRYLIQGIPFAITLLCSAAMARIKKKHRFLNLRHCISPRRFSCSTNPSFKVSVKVILLSMYTAKI